VVECKRIWSDIHRENKEGADITDVRDESIYLELATERKLADELTLSLRPSPDVRRGSSVRVARFGVQ